MYRAGLSAVLLFSFLGALAFGQAPAIRPARPPAAAEKEEEAPEEKVGEARAAGPKVAGLELSPANPKVKAEEGYLLIEAKTTGEVVKWIVVGSAPTKYNTLGKSIVVSLPHEGGFIHVYAYTSLDGKPTDAAITKVEIQGINPKPGPTPGPSPGPIPPPNPSPPVPTDWATGPLNVIVIDDNANRSKYPYMAQIMTNTGLRDSIQKGGHRFVALNITDPAIDTFKLRPHLATAGGPPALLIMNGKGFVGAKVPCPQTPNDVVLIVNKAIAGK